MIRKYDIININLTSISHDVEIANGSVVTRVVEGIVTVTPQVTR